MHASHKLSNQLIELAFFQSDDIEKEEEENNVFDSLWLIPFTLFRSRTKRKEI